MHLGGRRNLADVRTDASRNRDRIVEAYLALSRPHRASPALTDVADAAGVSRMTLYRHFKDAEALRRAAYLRLLDEVTESLERVAAGGGSIEEKLAGIAEEMLARVGQMQIVFSGQDWYDRKAMRHWSAWVRPLVELIREAQERGELRDDLSAEWLADAMLWLLHGATIIPVGLDQFNVGRSVLSTFLDGARPSRDHEDLEQPPPTLRSPPRRP